MQKPTLGEKVRYYFENTMSAGPSGVIKWLALISLFMVLVLGVIILIFGIKSSPEAEAEKLGFIEGAWQSLMATLDSGTMGGDEGWPFRAVRFIATLGGIFLISILIGTISSGIDEKFRRIKKRSLTRFRNQPYFNFRLVRKSIFYHIRNYRSKF